MPKIFQMLCGIRCTVMAHARNCWCWLEDTVPVTWVNPKENGGDCFPNITFVVCLELLELAWCRDFCVYIYASHKKSVEIYDSGGGETLTIGFV